LEKVQQAKQRGYGRHEIGKDYIIRSYLNGYITGDVARSLVAETKQLAAELHRQGHRAYLLIDISGVTGQSSDARIAAKEIGGSGLDKIAVVGGGRALSMIGQYVARAGGMGGYTRFFRTNAKATNWLVGKGKAIHESHTLVRTVPAFIAVLIALGTLFGWVLNVPALTSFIPNLNPMNPMTALAIIFVGIVIFLFQPGKLSRSTVLLIIVSSTAVCLFGVATFLQFVTGMDTHVDQLLFGGQMAASISGGRSAFGSSLGLVLVSAMIGFALGARRSRWLQYGFYVCSMLLLFVALLTLLRYAFGIDRLYQFGRHHPMALNAAVAFLLIDYALQYVTKPLPLFQRLLSGVNAYGQAIAVAALVLAVTGVAWQQNKVDLQRSVDAEVETTFATMQDAMSDRMNTYVNALGGFKAFFQSSSSVTTGEFGSYFSGSRLAQNYPGFSTISFARYVPANNQQAFLKEMKAQADSVPQYATLQIEPQGQDMLYPLTYAEPHTATTSYGFNLGSESMRRQAFETARDSGQPTATGVINLNASQGSRAPFRPGFFITVPVYRFADTIGEPRTIDGRRASIYGFVNSVFEDKALFDGIFADIKQPQIRLTISYAQSGDVVYAYNQAAKNIDAAVRKRQSITVGGQEFTLTMQASDTFGTTRVEQLLPTIILFGGITLALLAAALMVNQVRGRKQALDLAAGMTEDLNNERNAAITLQQKDEAILSSIGDAVFAVDRDGLITVFNPAAEAISGYARAEAIGRSHREVLHFVLEATGKPTSAFISRAISGHLTAMKNHTVLVRKDGSHVAVADSAAPIRNAQGNLMGAIVVFRDVSKEQALDKAKNEFVSLASHQLRTPLSAINWYTEMLLSGDAGKLNKEQTEYMREMYEGNQRMIDLVNSLLDVSRLDLGRLANAPSPVDMNELAHSLERELESSINGRGLTFEKVVDPKLATVSADVKLLRMAMQNLLSNAVKYTPEKGSVTLTMRAATQDELHQAKLHGAGPYFFMSVADTGYGIPKEQQSKIFQKMFRADNVQKIGVEGTGLGLYIVREVAKKLGGTVWFESTEKVGTTFYFVIPFKTKASTVRAKMET
jgi:PAS domain S-box-containing protein